MSCGQILGPAEFHLVTASSGDEQMQWFTPWVPAIGLDKVKAVIRNKALSGNFTSRLLMQLAEVRTDNPSATVALEENWSSSADRCTGVIDISANTASKFFARFGAGYKLSSGSATGQSDVALELVYDACGKIIGGTTLTLFAPGTTSRFVPVTAWIPALPDKVKAVVIITNSSANFRCQLTYRTATHTRDLTNAWASNFEGAWHNGNGEFSTGEKSLSTGSDMYIQFGLEYSLSSGTDGEATAQVIVAVRRT